MKPNINRDLLASVPAEGVAQATMQSLCGLQDFPAQVQVMAAAAQCILLCDRAGVRVPDIITFARNVLDCGPRHPAFRPVVEYIANEL
jgi:hypothetical protein